MCDLQGERSRNKDRALPPLATRTTRPRNTSPRWSSLIMRSRSPEPRKTSGVSPLVVNPPFPGPAVRKSLPKVQHRSGLPPTACSSSPPALAFSRRRGPPDRSSITKVTGTLVSASYPATRPSSISSRKAARSHLTPSSQDLAPLSSTPDAPLARTVAVSKSSCAATVNAATSLCSLSHESQLDPLLAEGQAGSTGSAEDRGCDNVEVDRSCPAPPLHSRPLDETREIPVTLGSEVNSAPRTPVLGDSAEISWTTAVGKGPGLVKRQASLDKTVLSVPEANTGASAVEMDGHAVAGGVSQHTALDGGASRNRVFGRKDGSFDPMSADDGTDYEESEPRRASSLRKSSFVTTPRAFGLRGCLPRRSSAPESGMRGIPAHPSMRFLGGSRSSTPKESPKGTPSRFRSRRKGSRHLGTPAADGASTDGESRNSGRTGGRTAIYGGGGSGQRRALSTGPPGEESAGADRMGQPRDVSGLKPPGEFSDDDATTDIGTEVSTVVQAKQEVPLEPEAVVASSVSMKGSLECGRAMRMDGSFKGQLVSKGDVTVGPTGRVTGDLKGLKFLRVEGLVIGDVVCDKVMVLAQGKVFGDISANSLTLGPETTVKGRITVVKDPSMLRPKMKEGVASRRKVKEEAKKVEAPAPAKIPELEPSKEETQAPGTGTESEDRAPASTVIGGDVEKPVSSKPKEVSVVYIESKRAQKPSVSRLQRQSQDLGKHAFSDDESQGSDVEGDGDDEDSGEEGSRKSMATVVKVQQQSAGQAPPENIVAKVVAAVEKRQSGGGSPVPVPAPLPASDTAGLGSKPPLKAVAIGSGAQALSEMSVANEVSA